MANKRGPQGDSVALSKRARVEDVDESAHQMMISQNAQGKGVVSTVKRTSGLQQPIMVLQGHTVSQDLLLMFLGPRETHAGILSMILGGMPGCSI